MLNEPYGGSTATPFEPDILLPTQYLASLQRGRIDESERCLMLAVLEDAVDTYRKHATARDRRGQVLFGEAEEWFASESTAWPFAFESICDVLDLNADRIRKDLEGRRWMFPVAAVLPTNRAPRGQIERHRREVNVRITAEEQQQVVRPALAPDIRRQHQNLDEDLWHFASFVSHEIRQPLASRQMFLELLETRIADPERTRAYLAALRASVVRIASSLDGQHTLVRTMTSGEDASFDVPVDLDALLAETAGVFAAPLAEIGGTIAIAPLGTIDGNPDQLRQVFRNLIENAVKYRHPERPLIITVTATVTGDGMREIVVADNGAGFAPKDEVTMFAMFRRLDPSRTDGSGVGLALCRRIVERHGGRIRAHGHPGEGATLVVSVPLSRVNTPPGVGGLRGTAWVGAMAPRVCRIP